MPIRRSPHCRGRKTRIAWPPIQLRQDRLATDVKKRELFKKLAVDLCAVAHDIQSMIGHVDLPCASTYFYKIANQPALTQGNAGDRLGNVAIGSQYRGG
jgi:hypothetical protein